MFSLWPGEQDAIDYDDSCLVGNDPLQTPPLFSRRPSVERGMIRSFDIAQFAALCAARSEPGSPSAEAEAARRIDIVDHEGFGCTPVCVRPGTSVASSVAVELDVVSPSQDARVCVAFARGGKRSRHTTSVRVCTTSGTPGASVVPGDVTVQTRWGTSRASVLYVPRGESTLQCVVEGRPRGVLAVCAASPVEDDLSPDPDWLFTFAALRVGGELSPLTGASVRCERAVSQRIADYMAGVDFDSMLDAGC